MSYCNRCGSDGDYTHACDHASNLKFPNVAAVPYPSGVGEVEVLRLVLHQKDTTLTDVLVLVETLHARLKAAEAVVEAARACATIGESFDKRLDGALAAYDALVKS